MSQLQAQERWTVGKLIQWTSDFLKRKGAESPRLDSEVLLAHVLAWPRVQLYTRFEDEIDDSARSRFRELVKQRAEGKPVAYLVGRKEFYSIDLRVDPNVLIPRPETEFLVLEFLTAFKNVEAPFAVDIGTGSGCVALACLHQHKTARFLATDISPRAVDTALENARRVGVEGRFEARVGSLYEAIRGSAPFDAILSNPPYLRTDEIAALAPDVRDFEPHLALDGGTSGLDAIRPLIAEAADLLRPGGRLLIEFGFDQADSIRELVALDPRLELVGVIQDGARHPRVLHARRTQ
ncbi:MAG: peptide chain release factor N(5)-glutamine methyltransferase [Isosphaeraceae bacterium]|nr:peptide chain release factor N(5)-glutamine methyltransferase [Isosphaeraceae bacterium]